MLASIVEKETGRNDERERVAAVFHQSAAAEHAPAVRPDHPLRPAGRQGGLGPADPAQRDRAEDGHNTYQIDGLPPTADLQPGPARDRGGAQSGRDQGALFRRRRPRRPRVLRDAQGPQRQRRKWRKTEQEIKAEKAEKDKAKADAAIPSSTPPYTNAPASSRRSDPHPTPPTSSRATARRRGRKPAEQADKAPTSPRSSRRKGPGAGDREGQGRCPGQASRPRRSCLGRRRTAKSEGARPASVAAASCWPRALQLDSALDQIARASRRQPRGTPPYDHQEHDRICPRRRVGRLDQLALGGALRQRTRPRSAAAAAARLRGPGAAHPRGSRQAPRARQPVGQPERQAQRGRLADPPERAGPAPGAGGARQAAGDGRRSSRRAPTGCSASAACSSSSRPRRAKPQRAPAPRRCWRAWRRRSTASWPRAPAKGAGSKRSSSTSWWRSRGWSRRSQRSPARTPEAIRQRLKEQVARLLEPGVPLDRARLHQEAALLATRADVEEELKRLTAHIAGARELLGSSEPAGRASISWRRSSTARPIRCARRPTMPRRRGPASS